MADKDVPGTGTASSLDERLEAIWAEAARAGRHLPGEPTLATTLSSSRPAVREALIRLEERGYIHRRKGADTAVNPSVLGIPARFDQRLEASALITAMGCTPRVDVLETSTSRITIEEATEHDLPPATEAYRVTKRWSADGIPVMIASDSVPISKHADRTSTDPHMAMVDLAEQLMGERAGWEVVWPSADVLDSKTAERVGLETGAPALVLEISGVSRRGAVCYWTQELHLRGFFRYAMVRQADWH